MNQYIKIYMNTIMNYEWCKAQIKVDIEEHRSSRFEKLIEIESTNENLDMSIELAYFLPNLPNTVCLNKV